MAGAVFFGVSSAGADLAWGLWVTKFAPPEHVAGYMSVRTCFTGVGRPGTGGSVLSGLRDAARCAGLDDVGLIAIGSAFLVPEDQFGPDGPPSALRWWRTYADHYVPVRPD